MIKNKIQVQEFLYDFSVDGGAQGAINLHSKANKSVLPVGAIVKGVTAKVLTAVESAGAATLAWGNGDDADGYSGTAIAKTSLTANALFNGWDNSAALLWDTDHTINFNVADEDDGKFIVTIGTADLTAGKVVFIVEYFMPAEVL